MVDVVVAGGGPAGLNAALMLGRAQRETLVCNTGTSRNQSVAAMHGFLSRDGFDPAELRRVGRQQLAQYRTVSTVDVGIEAAAVDADGFTVRLADGTEVSTRRLLLATGVVDELPAIEGLAEHWGRGVFNCPYCDGWELRDQPLAVLGSDPHNMLMAANLVRWSADVVVCTNGTGDLDDATRELLAGRAIEIREEPVTQVEGTGNDLERITFADGPTLSRRAMFFHAPTRQRSPLASQLGCTFLDDGSVQVDDLGHTDVTGVFAAGDMARRPTMPVPGEQVAIAAAEGVIAAVAIDQELCFESLA